MPWNSWGGRLSSGTQALGPGCPGVIISAPPFLKARGRPSGPGYSLGATPYALSSPRPQEEPTTWTGYFGKVLMASTSYLPAQVTEMFTQGRAFATVRLPFCGHKNICSLAT